MTEPFRPRPGDERLTAAIVSDSLDALGYRDQVLQTQLVPLLPGRTVLGRASTVQFAPSLRDDSDDPYRDAISYIDRLEQNDVVVIATDASNSSAFWGELFSAAALGRKAGGLVTDGNVRDTAKIRDLGFATFCPAHRPVDFRARMAVVATHGTVRISGVDIDHGDLVIADDDGVVIVPGRIEAETLELARDRAATESTVLNELREGASLRAVWDRYHVL